MSEPDAVPELAREGDHVGAGLALLPHQFRGATKLRALLAAFLGQCQEVEDALWQVWSATLAAATGDALDQIGELLVWPRGSLADADYRTVLLQVVTCNRSAGTGDELLSVLEALLGATAYTLTEYFPAAVLVEPDAAPALGTALLHALLQRAKPAGVKLHTIDILGGSAFKLASGELVETDPTAGLSDVLGSTGGAFTGVLA